MPGTKNPGDRITVALEKSDGDHRFIHAWLHTAFMLAHLVLALLGRRRCDRGKLNGSIELIHEI